MLSMANSTLFNMVDSPPIIIIQVNHHLVIILLQMTSVTTFRVSVPLPDFCKINIFVVIFVWRVELETFTLIGNPISGFPYLFCDSQLGVFLKTLSYFCFLLLDSYRNIINPVLQKKHSFDSFVLRVNTKSIAPKPICIFYFLFPKNLPFEIKIVETLDKLFFLEPLELAKRSGKANRQKLVQN